MKHALPLVVMTLSLGGCAGADTAHYPSLLPRPIESRSDAEPVAAPPAAATADPALDAKLDEYRASLDKTDNAFGPAADHAEALAKAAHGDAVGSDHWLDAQTALAQLDTYRSDLSAMLTDVEQLAIDRAAGGQPDYPGIEELRARVKAASDAETARITNIQAMLPAA